MPVESDVYSPPVSLYNLSFDSNEFLKKSFSVDEYLQEHRNKTSLETLRDDLGIYLRILRSSMIELINKDYADFVNLSSNLIGLDRAINGMQFPLGQLKEEIVQVKIALEEALNGVTDLLKCRHDVFVKKLCLQNLINVEFFLSKFGYVLDSEETPHKYFLDPDFTERVASEYNKLLFSISQCEVYLTNLHSKKTSRISEAMMLGLNDMFLKSLKMKDMSSIARCLRTYAALDKVHEAEMLYRKNMVAPAISSVISETAMESNIVGLNGVYNRLLDFVKVDMSNLLELTKLTRRFPAVKSFSFVLNSFWPEVEERLEMNLSSIFAPGNPDLFYKHFSETEMFMKKLEYFCGVEEDISKFRSHPQYQSFINKWNLSIYFQIRFQEIGGPVEFILGGDRNLAFSTASNSSLKLVASETVWNNINRCWSDGIFLKQLTHKFWKLNLLILARYNFWISAVLHKWPLSVESAGIASTSTVKEGHEKSAVQSLQYLVCLYNDIEKLIEMLPSLQSIVMSKATQISQDAQKIFERSQHSSQEQLKQQLPKVTQEIVSAVSHRSILQLKQVNDIPRLYRRTNREVPTKACSYVLQMLAPPTKFCAASASSVSPKLLDHWLLLIFSAITKQYFIAVSDVLTSVQKTEESLRRLKKIRDRSTSANLVEGRGIGDDDKIRLQLALDVRTFCEEVENKGLNRSEVEKLQELINLVEEATLKSEK
ncbi:conserved oligomeric Golgi complex subunit 2 isoform X1 [Schistocerca piceifrons]|uniref:conserved oligomeric Golgi complex subunit 2 isoform X1 n=1 Tax=Schistocerca piceifrons TaxID=274613 RepID=UPI001F5F5A27|nr:conserved oligomeric Golgi complex subunit 2 isoform X1 [Schistocerca piceifrons]